MALLAVDWSQWKDRARAFLREHQGVEVRDLTRSERLLLPGAKAAWAVVHYKAASHIRSLGAQPCDLCGEWTCAWCEACSRPPRAVCTECDREHLLCNPCLAKGLIYKEVAVQGEEGFLEISGYHDDETGGFVTFDPPFKMPTADVPQRADGSYDVEQLMEFVTSGRWPRAPAGGRPARPPQ